MSRHEPTSTALRYGIEAHTHLFAAWAASRAASVKNCRFSVEQGRTILEDIGFRPALSNPDHLPGPSDVDAVHRSWREAAIASGSALGLALTHGVAAKLINVYLKARFVCAGHHAHARVAALHPPIDSVLLKALAQQNFGGQSKAWRKAENDRWSKLKSDEYENLISLIRVHLGGRAMWMIEEYWKGNQ